MDGYGKTGYDLDDFDTVLQLNSNIGVFSAFKSYRVNQEMKANLTDENGKKLSFDKFLDRYQKVDAEYNANYLRAEYNLAQRQAASANQWNDFKRSEELYPNLKYMPSRSAEPRQDHTKYYGIIKPINDPIWNDLIPPIAWGCNCWVTNTDEPSVATTVEPPQPVNGIIGNPGKNGAVFSISHAYSKGVDKQSKQQVATFLSKMKDKHWSDEHISSKVGKGRLKVSLNADTKDLSHNLQIGNTVLKNHGGRYEVRPHIEGVKNPEGNFNGLIGDATRYDPKVVTSAQNYIKNSFGDKYSNSKNKGQLRGFKESFLILDLMKKLKKNDFKDFMIKLKGEFNSQKKCKLVIIVNGDKSFIIDDFGKNTKDLIKIYDKAKKELL